MLTVVRAGSFICTARPQGWSVTADKNPITASGIPSMNAYALPNVELCDVVVDFTVITHTDVLVFEEDFGDRLSDAAYWSDTERCIDEPLLFDPQAYLRKQFLEVRCPAEFPDDYWRLQEQLMRLVASLACACSEGALSRSLSVTIDTVRRRAWIPQDAAAENPPSDNVLDIELPDLPDLPEYLNPLDDAVRYAESIIGEFQDHYQRFDDAFEDTKAR